MRFALLSRAQSCERRGSGQRRMGLGVWVFGETFGGILAPGQTWLAGAPGAAMIYCLAGLLLVLPDRCWANRRRGLWLLGGIGLFWPGMALAQAWPGRGFWQGPASHASPGSLASLVRQMVQTPQPHFLSTWVAAFAALRRRSWLGRQLLCHSSPGPDRSEFLAARGSARLGPRGRTVLCLAGSVLVEDLGGFGRPRHWPQQHGPHGPVVRGRLSRQNPGAVCRGPGHYQRGTPFLVRS